MPPTAPKLNCDRNGFRASQGKAQFRHRDLQQRILEVECMRATVLHLAEFLRGPTSCQGQSPRVALPVAYLDRCVRPAKYAKSLFQNPKS